MSRLYLITGTTPIRMTKDIVDPNRQILAHNMLRYMQIQGARFTVHGMEIPTDAKLVVKSPHEERKPAPLDPEFMSESGDKKGFRSVCVTEDGSPVALTPVVDDYEKANEMNNFLRTAIDPAISITCWHEGKYVPVVNNGVPVQAGIVNENGDLTAERLERNWASGTSPTLYLDGASNLKKVDVDVLVSSSVNADGFRVVVRDGENVIREHSYHCGWDCSWSRRFESETEPYVTDVLQNYLDIYPVENLNVRSGKNTFANKPVQEKRVQEFVKDYCQDLFLHGATLVVPDAVSSFVDAVASMSETDFAPEQ